MLSDSSGVTEDECGLVRSEIGDLKTEICSMKELIEKLTEENRALRARPRTPATVPLPPPPPTSSTPPPPRPKRKRTGPETPNQPTKVQRETSPIRAIGPPETGPATPAPEAPPEAAPEADKGWQKVERKWRHSGKGKKGRGGQKPKGNVAPPWANGARGRGGGIHFTVFLGGYGGYASERPRKPRRTGVAERGGGGTGEGVSGGG